jgi:ubiquitin carboxyl-terminal hydrolase 7
MTQRLAFKIATCFSVVAIVFATGRSDTILVSNGLRNLGNTCYMNAQLQCAFHIPRIRQILHGLVDPNISSKALIQLFKEMEECAVADRNFRAAAPTSFCRTLGIPTMQQQDSQEFWKLLLPSLNITELTDLYQGSYEDYITAVDGSGRERRREEVFLDLSLEVARHECVVSSLRDRFGSPELLCEAEGNGWRPQKGAEKIDALKGSVLRISGLPSLLQLHLKRFQYDWHSETMSKLNSRLAFPLQLDLSSACSEVYKSKNNEGMYDLQSVIVHVGDFSGGHYYAYVRPDIRKDCWIRFDDDRVSLVSYRDVAIDGYGGKRAERVRKKTKQGFLKRLLLSGASPRYGWGGPGSSAYMLQYVKRDEIQNLYDD